MARSTSSKPDPRVLKQWLIDRNLGRTDLFFLCHEILGYKDINVPVHGPMVQHLQKFAGCEEYTDPDTGKVVFSKPRVALWDLQNNSPTGTSRRTLTLMPRGSLKTSVSTIAHKIQWILNYPDVRILFNVSVGDKQTSLATEMLQHFRYNEKLRFYYPEYCPPAESAHNWGSLDGFIVPNQKVYRRAPTVSFASVGKVIAGPHYEVVIHSDIVDKNNVNTPMGIQEVVDHFRYCIPLIESSSVAPYTGWCDVEGTIYNFSDLYSFILEMRESGHPDWQKWSVLLVDAEKDSGKQLSYWPERYPWSRLQEIKNSEAGPAIYAANYRQKPIPEGGGLTNKGIDVKSFTKVIKPLLPQMRLHGTIDLHGMEDNLGNDFTVFNVSGFLRNGQVVCIDIRRGHFSPFDIIGLLFELDKYYEGKIVDWKIEKDAHARVLAPFLEREQEVRKRWLNIVPVQRDNVRTKQQRIRGLQSWFAGNVLSFSDSIVCLDDVLLEIKQFPKGRHDDILDTLADQMQNRDGGVQEDVVPMPKRSMQIVPGIAKFTGFDPTTHQPTWEDDPMDGIPSNWQPWMKVGV